MLLSLDQAVSGCSLTEATHIVLMDPMTGSKARILSIDQQAIGRAQRTCKQVSLI